MELFLITLKVPSGGIIEDSASPMTMVQGCLRLDFEPRRLVLRVVFLGTPKEVIPPLRALIKLHEAKWLDLVGVISQPSRPKGRKKELIPPPVALFAKEHQIPLWQPEKASDPAFLNQLRLLKPDIALTAAYGQILTDEFLAIPTRATINIHPSLLPDLRGATPVQSALLRGEKTTGVTILFTVKALDAGAIILQKNYPVKDLITADQLQEELFQLGADLLPEALEALSDPHFVGSPQQEELVTNCRKIEKQDGRVQWSEASQVIERKYQAYTPWPGLHTFYRGKRLLLEKVRMIEGQWTPGSLQWIEGVGLVAGCGKGGLLLERLRLEGRNSQSAKEFLNGQGGSLKQKAFDGEGNE